MRTRGATRAAVLAVVAGMLLGGCQAAMPGSGDVSTADRQRVDRRAELRSAVDGALGALAAQLALSYRSSYTDTAGKTVELALNVTKHGFAQGSFPSSGEQIKLLRADGKLYLNAGATYWRGRGTEAAVAEQYAGDWVRATRSELPFDPAETLTPSAVVATLRAGLAGADQLAEPVRRVRPDGTEVFEIETRSGLMEVTTAQPYRLVSVAPALLGPAVGSSYGPSTSVGMAALAGDDLKRFQTGAEAALPELAQPVRAGAGARTEVTDTRLDCGTNGVCTHSVQVRNTVVGDAAGALVRLRLSSLVNAEGIGEQTCTGEAVAAPGATTGLSCEVRFTLPNRTGTAKVVAMPSLTGAVLDQLDGPALSQKVRAEFAALGG
ncbi:hypothetical protein [Amycolatopsis nigrescens]|uniref:hypothetical protein n=1 Tax=Amycolatopsis nigrescens TaxID=381445 RepID=UPI00058C8ADA|nr:hypothetical protein [Amycolatopsis nigrescens]